MEEPVPADSPARRPDLPLRARRHEELADEVTALARMELFERGYEGVSVGDICMKAGISQRTFYRHFLSKDAVLMRTIERSANATHEAFAARPADEPILDAFAAASISVLTDPQMTEVDIHNLVILVRHLPVFDRPYLGGAQPADVDGTAEEIGRRLGCAATSPETTLCRALLGAPIQIAMREWYLSDRTTDLPSMIWRRLETVRPAIDALVRECAGTT
jgi:AcrR family transcriptional regulator